jgi:hypothetical protein
LFSGNGLFGLIDPIWTGDAVDDNAVAEPWTVDISPPLPSLSAITTLSDAEKYSELVEIVQRARVLKRLDNGLRKQYGDTFFTEAVNNAMKLLWITVEKHLLLEEGNNDESNI